MSRRRSWSSSRRPPLRTRGRTRGGVPVVSIRELKWNARIGVVSQLVWLIGRLPQTVQLVAGVLAGAAVLLVAALAALLIGWLYAHLAVAIVAAAAWIAWRVVKRRRRLRAERDEVPF